MAPPPDRPRSQMPVGKRKRVAAREPRAPLVPVLTETEPPRPRETRATRTSNDETRIKQPAYVAQRQERHALLDQVRALEAHVDELRRLAGLPTQQDKDEIDGVRALSVKMDEQLHATGRYLNRLNSMITNELLLPAVNTLSTFIHLPRDMDQRRAILRSIQEVKLRRGIEVATQWLGHLDHSIPFVDEKAFTIPSGECHYLRAEIDQFRNFRTARELYDTFVQFLYNMEISVTEGLGQLTLREDSDDTFDPTIWNHRFVTVAEDVGVPEELNFVAFAQFYPHSSYTNSPMGIIVYDTVNVDDLYPYLPEERTCKDVQGTHMVFEVPKPGTNETVVVLKQCRVCVQLPPRFEVADNVLRQLQQNFSNWPNYIVKYLHEYVVADTSGAVGH